MITNNAFYLQHGFTSFECTGIPEKFNVQEADTWLRSKGYRVFKSVQTPLYMKTNYNVFVDGILQKEHEMLFKLTFG